MRRLQLTALLLWPISLLADGPWEQVGDADDGSTYYVETSSLKKTSQGARVWTMASLTAPKDGFLSAKTLFEFNCKSHKHHIIDMAFYSQPMGQGDQVKNVLIPKTVWVATDPDSTEGAYLEFSCSHLGKP